MILPRRNHIHTLASFDRNGSVLNFRKQRPWLAKKKTRKLQPGGGSSATLLTLLPTTLRLISVEINSALTASGCFMLRGWFSTYNTEVLQSEKNSTNSFIQALKTICIWFSCIHKHCWPERKLLTLTSLGVEAPSSGTVTGCEEASLQLFLLFHLVNTCRINTGHSWFKSRPGAKTFVRCYFCVMVVLLRVHGVLNVDFKVVQTEQQSAAYYRFINHGTVSLTGERSHSSFDNYR